MMIRLTGSNHKKSSNKSGLNDYFLCSFNVSSVYLDTQYTQKQHRYNTDIMALG
jgi:hypothetical protein